DPATTLPIAHFIRFVPEHRPERGPLVVQRQRVAPAFNEGAELQIRELEAVHGRVDDVCDAEWRTDGIDRVPDTDEGDPNLLVAAQAVTGALSPRQDREPRAEIAPKDAVHLAHRALELRRVGHS